MRFPHRQPPRDRRQRLQLPILLLLLPFLLLRCVRATSTSVRRDGGFGQLDSGGRGVKSGRGVCVFQRGWSLKRVERGGTGAERGRERGVRPEAPARAVPHQTFFPGPNAARVVEVVVVRVRWGFELIERIERLPPGC